MTLPIEPRTVKPRKPTGQQWLPIIVADRAGRTIYCEMTGSFHGWDEAPSLFRAHPPAIVIACDAAHLVADLSHAYGDAELWQYRVTPVKRERYNPDPTRRRLTVSDTVVNYFGWRGSSYTTETNRKANRKGYWHYPLDPTLFCSSPVKDITGGTDAMTLLAWGQDVRAWIHANDLHPSPTAGGLAGQLLRDPRWYPDARRKVPRATNARGRAALPGNYYRLYWPVHKPVNATYIDMSGSHHHAAASIHFPSSNHLYARGAFRTPDTTETTDIWTRHGTARFARIMQSHGLFLLQLNVPALKPDQFPPPYMEKAGRVIAWVFSNELPALYALGGIVEAVAAAWTSYETETGLNHYAQWALTETATMDAARKRWAKVVLLAAYGNLAARARTTEFAYRTAQEGIPRDYPAGPHRLPAIAHVTDIEREVPTVNTIHRGMIEAEQRRITLDLARTLTQQGHTVLSIYADAIIVRSDRQLPLLPPPWRVDAHLTNLRFASPTSFRSDERTKLPGMTREDRERFDRLARIRRHAPR